MLERFGKFDGQWWHGLDRVDNATHVLFLRLGDPGQVESIHGARISGLVRRDFSRRFGIIARSILRRHELLDKPCSPESGTWLTFFRMRTAELGTESEDQIAAITESGMELVRGMLDEELGRAAAMHVDFRFGIFAARRAGCSSAGSYEPILMKIRSLEPARTLPGVSRESFQEILRGPRLDLRLQPIVSLDDLQPVGFEALARGPSGGPVERADRLFAAASYYGLRPELEVACLKTALSKASRLPAPYWLSVNLAPDLFDSPALRRLVKTKASLGRRVFEITEHIPIESTERLLRAVRPLRENGGRVALDDAGCGFLNMGLVTELAPNIVKFCITVIRRIEDGPATLRGIKAAVARIKAAGASPLAEGVERKGQLRLVRECGFDLAQGYLFGRPQPAADVLAGLC